jgi:hypothetical protein
VATLQKKVGEEVFGVFPKLVGNSVTHLGSHGLGRDFGWYTTFGEKFITYWVTTVIRFLA